MAIYYRDFKNIMIDDPPEHQRDVVGQLDKAWATWTGWTVLRAIIDTPGKAMTIVPFSDDDEKKRPGAGAYVRPAWGLRAVDGTPKGEPMFLGRNDDPSTPEDERYQTVPLVRGTGRGVNSEMHYTGKKFEDHYDVPPCPRDGTVSTGVCRLGLGIAAYGPDYCLVHEMVHALRFMRGLFNSLPTWDKGYDNEEEYFAILVGNIYISEKRRKQLVANHHGYGALPAELSTSEGFLGKGASPPSRDQLENRRLVHKFVLQNYGLCARLSVKVTCAFNPIREFMRNSQLYPLFPR